MPTTMQRRYDTQLNATTLRDRYPGWGGVHAKNFRRAYGGAPGFYHSRISPTERTIRYMRAHHGLELTPVEVAEIALALNVYSGGHGKLERSTSQLVKERRIMKRRRQQRARAAAKRQELAEFLEQVRRKVEEREEMIESIPRERAHL